MLLLKTKFYVLQYKKYRNSHAHRNMNLCFNIILKHEDVRQINLKRHSIKISRVHKKELCVPIFGFGANKMWQCKDANCYLHRRLKHAWISAPLLGLIFPHSITSHESWAELIFFNFFFRTSKSKRSNWSWCYKDEQYLKVEIEFCFLYNLIHYEVRCWWCLICLLFICYLCIVCLIQQLICL